MNLTGICKPFKNLSFFLNPVNSDKLQPAKNIEVLLSEERELCSECNEKSLYTDEQRGEVICRNCGAVYETVQIGQAKKAFTKKEIEDRSTYNPEHKKKLGAWTTFRSSDIKVDAKPAKIAKFARLLKYNNSTTNSKERNYIVAVPKFSTLKIQLNLPDYVDALSWKIYKKAVEKKLMRGRSINSFATACTMIALRHHKLARLPDEARSILNVHSKNLNQALRIIIKEILPDMKIKYLRTGVKDYLIHVMNECSLSKYTSPCIDICRIVEHVGNHSLMGKDPKGIAGAIVYSWCKKINYSNTQTYFAQAFKVTEVTLRNRAKELKQKCKLESILERVYKKYYPLN